MMSVKEYKVVESCFKADLNVNEFIASERHTILMKDCHDDQNRRMQASLVKVLSPQRKRKLQEEPAEDAVISSFFNAAETRSGYNTPPRSGAASSPAAASSAASSSAERSSAPRAGADAVIDLSSDVPAGVGLPGSEDEQSRLEALLL